MDERTLRHIALMDDETMLTNVPADLFARLVLAAGFEMRLRLLCESPGNARYLKARRLYDEACEWLYEFYNPTLWMDNA